MSTESNSVCLSIVNGRDDVDRWPRVDWQGSAKATFERLPAVVDISRMHPWDQWNISILPAVTRRKELERRYFLYLAECCVFNGAATIFKVGITSHVKSRIIVHERNPLLLWSEVNAFECGSKKMAASCETAVLAAAACAGQWLGGEYIAGCRASQRLAITQKHGRKDARFRVRAKESAYGR